MHPTIQNNLTHGVKMTQIKPFINIICAQQKLNPKLLSHYKRAKRILLISINQN